MSTEYALEGISSAFHDFPIFENRLPVHQRLQIFMHRASKIPDELDMRKLSSASALSTLPSATYVRHQLGTHRNPDTSPFLDKGIPCPERVQQDGLLLLPFLRALQSSTLRLSSAMCADVGV